MEAGSRWYTRRTSTSGVVVFVVVLLLVDWVFYAASFAIFRLAPAAVPDNFYIVVQLRGADRYDALTWKAYPAARAEQRVETFLLPDSAHTMPGKATFSFTVLKSRSGYQLVEVQFDGPYESVSRYEAYADRVVPVAYRSMTWGEAQDRHWIVFLMGVALAALAAWAASFAMKRLMRLQQT
jgi:hypothetical protein